MVEREPIHVVKGFLYVCFGLNSLSLVSLLKVLSIKVMGVLDELTTFTVILGERWLDRSIFHDKRERDC